MQKILWGVAAGIVTLVVATGGVKLALAHGTSPVDSLADLRVVPEEIKKSEAPEVKDPQWAAEPVKAAVPASSQRIVTYDVGTRGNVRADLAEFKQRAHATLNDSRGWARMGIGFREVAGGGMFTLLLAEANQLPLISPGCGSEYSCRAGRFVIINQDRWMGATDPWNAAGGTLRDYQHMVVNHEVGHWLGHDHQDCAASGQPAMVMQQQSMNLQGCSFNPWPVASELWSTQLGIVL